MSKRKMKMQWGRALVQPNTIDVERREVDVVFATETPVPRFGWEEDYDEVLVCEPDAVRMDRANRGLPVMDCHSTYSVFHQLGRSIKVWFNDNRELCARICFSSRAEVVELFADIAAGIVKDISVGYQVYKFERTEQPGAPRPTYRAIDWMPTELSFAPVQADINSEVRNSQDEHTVEIISIQTSNTKTMKRADEGKTTQYTVEGEPVKAGDIVTAGDVKGVALTDGEVGDTITLTLIEDDSAESADNVTAAAEEAAAAAIDAAGAAEDAAAAAQEAAAAAAGEPGAEEEARSRMDAILKSTRAAKLPDTFAIGLFRSKLNIDQCRQAVIIHMAKNQRNVNGGHAVSVGLDGATKKRTAVQNAILHRVYPAKFSLDAGAREFRGMTLIEMGKELLHEHGVSTRGLSKTQVADRVFGRSMSSSDFPLLFEGVIDKMLRAQYEFAPEHWDKIARQTTVMDFRAKGLYQAGSTNGMKKVAEGGEIKYTKLTESKSTIRVESYAEGISFTRQAFINDDLGAFAVIPANFVKDWDETRGALVWGLLIDNVKMADEKNLFSADHANLLTGANSALSEAGLSNAKVLLSRQKSIDGRIIRVLPKYLIVPPELEVTAKKLITDITPTKATDANVFANAFDVIVEPRLTDATAWYLSADPNAVDSLYYAYLEGNETLRVNSDENFKTDSMDYAVRGDFGAAAIDYRGVVKANGK